MKGAYGLVLAIALGLAGGLFNWAYLENKSVDEEKEAFVGIKPDAQIERGQRLEQTHLEPVEIPRRAVGNLKGYAVPYSAVQSILGRPVWRHLAGGSLLLEQDLRTPPQELAFGPNERVIWVGVDMRSLVPSLIVPGDLVSFRVPAMVGVPTPAEQGGAGPPAPSRRSGHAGDTIGPFKVLSLGNRLGSSEVLRAAKIPQIQENVMAISVPVDQQGNVAPDAEKLMKILDETDSRPLRIILHPRQERP